MAYAGLIVIAAILVMAAFLVASGIIAGITGLFVAAGLLTALLSFMAWRAG